MPPPTGRGRGQTQTEKAERGFGQNSSRHADGCLHDDGLQNIGQDMPGKNAQIGGAKGARGFDEFPFLYGEYLGSYQAGIADPSADGQGKHQVQKPWTQKSYECDRQQNARERQNAFMTKIFSSVSIPPP